MYETHFGLTSRPFGAKAEGAAVFVGPQQAKTIASLHKGLGAEDAVVTVTGPAGVGKTTIVSRALDQISPGRMVAWIGRMPLAPDEILDLLLAGFGVQRQPRSAIQRFAAFRRLLAERASAGAQVAIVVEDAERIGADALIELEALTAADAGDATGANIILMGQPGLNALLARPELARMKQRNRLQRRIDPMTLPEVQGYLRHAIRQAGGNFDERFDPGVADVVFACSEGIPRMINTLCGTAMTTAMEEGALRISAALVHQVAVDAFGYDGPVPDARTPAGAGPTPEPAGEVDNVGEKDEPAAPPPAAEATPAAERSVEEIENTNEEDLPPAARNIIVESGRYPELPALPDAPPASASRETGTDTESPAAPHAAAAERTEKAPSPGDDDIPDLINDTQPELTQLSGSGMPTTDEAVADPDAGPADAPAKPQDTDAVAAQSAASDQGKRDGEAAFDLDAALAVDAGDTNVMEGITPHLDRLAADDEAAGESTDPPAPVLDDLPTLSDSMRVDVDNDARKARPAAESGAHAASPASARDAAPEKETASGPTPPPAGGLRAEPAPAQAPNPAPPASAADDAHQGPAPTSAPQRAPDPEPNVLLGAEPPEAPAPESRATENPAEPTPATREAGMTPQVEPADTETRTGDVDSLAAALEAAKEGEADHLPEPPVPPAPAKAEDLPEITLDQSLADQVAGSDDLDQFAAEIARAQSLEEFSDKMAETLFGNEDLDAIAASVVANPPAVDAATPTDTAGEPSPVRIAESIELDAADPAPAAPVPPPSIDGNLRESQAMRMDLLNSLKSGTPPAQAKGVQRDAAPAPKPRAPKPEPIENQISTSMTQTLEALSVARVADEADEAAEDEAAPAAKKSGGLFSRFRKSS